MFTKISLVFLIIPLWYISKTEIIEWKHSLKFLATYRENSKLGSINLHYHQQWFEKAPILPPFKMVFSNFCDSRRQTNKLISNFLLILLEFHWLQWHWIFSHITITICVSSVNCLFLSSIHLSNWILFFLSIITWFLLSKILTIFCSIAITFYVLY